MSVSFICNDGMTEVAVNAFNNDEHRTWDSQADLFFRFLLAQGYVLSEVDLASFYIDRADQMVDCRSNIKFPNGSGDTGCGGSCGCTLQ